MTPKELKEYLKSLVENKIYLSTMIWGAPGIGKSSIVKQVAQANSLAFIDLRLSQLAPTDLRGLPVALPSEKKDNTGTSTWYPPEFLPTEGKGILFLDELNMAIPAIQGVAQQLILDRCIGSYKVPDGWYIWSAGNRKEDKASVFEMPAPLANRFLHLEVEADFDSFKSYAIAKKIDEKIIAFLSHRPSLLSSFVPNQNSFPSPRSWEMASELFKANLEINPAVGEATGAEFKAFVDLYENLPNLDKIKEGKGDEINFPIEPSTQWACIVGLVIRSSTSKEIINSLLWLTKKAPLEWRQVFLIDLNKKQINKGDLMKEYLKHPILEQSFKEYTKILSEL